MITPSAIGASGLGPGFLSGGLGADVEPTWVYDGVTLDSRILGQHLCNTLHVYGSGFAAGAEAKFGTTWDAAEDCEVEVVSASELEIVTPLCSVEGLRSLWVRPRSAAAWGFVRGDLVISGAGYRILRALLPDGRYTRATANALNVRLAALGRQLDQLEYARRALTEVELFPATAENLLHRWERVFGVPTVLGDAIATRQARVEARRRLEPRLTVDYLNTLIEPILPTGEVVENAHTATGDQGWQFQVYESTPGELPLNSYGELLSMLSAACAGWIQPALGHDGFVVGASRVSRDFVLAEE